MNSNQIKSIQELNSLLPSGITARLTMKGLKYCVRTSKSVKGYQHKISLGSFDTLEEACKVLNEFKDQLQKERMQMIGELSNKLNIHFPTREEIEKAATHAQIQKTLVKIPEDILNFLDWNRDRNPLVIEGTSQTFLDQEGDPITVTKSQLAAWWEIVNKREISPAPAQVSESTAELISPSKPYIPVQQTLQNLIDLRDEWQERLNALLEIPEAAPDEIKTLSSNIKDMNKHIQKVLNDATGENNQDKDNEDPFSI